MTLRCSTSPVADREPRGSSIRLVREACLSERLLISALGQRQRSATKPRKSSRQPHESHAHRGSRPCAALCLQGLAAPGGAAAATHAGSRRRALNATANSATARTFSSNRTQDSGPCQSDADCCNFNVCLPVSAGPLSRSLGWMRSQFRLVRRDRKHPIRATALAALSLALCACGGPTESNQLASGGAEGGMAGGGASGAASAAGKGGGPEVSGAGGVGAGAQDGGGGTLMRSRIALGADFGCAISSSGSVACWGTPTGNLGQTTPPQGPFTSLAASPSITCGLTATSLVACWGDTSGAGADQIPTGLTGRFISVGAGGQCVVNDASQIVCWGRSGAIDGQPPTELFLQVGVGRNFACALTAVGAIVCWGANADGKATPPAGKFIQLAIGQYHSCGLRDDGAAVCWGLGGPSMPTDGGVGATGSNPEPWGQSAPPAGKKFKRLAVGFLHSCGILVSGDIECWGAGAKAGECKTFATCGQGVRQNGPFVDLALGASNSCGVLESGGIRCWGSNSGGRSTPPADFQ